MRKDWINKVARQFDRNGFLRHEESGRATVDLDFPLIVRTTGVGRPTMATLQGRITAPQWAVGDNLSLEGQELIHSWVEESPLDWHTHLITNGSDGTDRYVNIELEFTWANVNSQLQGSTIVTSGNFRIPANTPDRTHLVIPIHTFVPEGARIATHVYAYLERIAATDAAAAPTADPFVTMLQAHTEIDGLGSKTPWQK